MAQREYVIQRLINNNVVFSLDESGKEIILFGKAIGFGKKRGDTVPKEAIIERFEMADANQRLPDESGGDDSACLHRSGSQDHRFV